MTTNVTVTVEEYVATVVLDRPPVNAVDRHALHEIRDAFRSLGDRRDVRVVIFTAAGTRAFMGGADLSSTGDTEDSDHIPPGEQLDRGLPAREAMWAITDCPVPVIGAINGPAVGAGVAFAACCDMLLAADHVTFGTLEINVGLLGASAHLARLVGWHKAREMFFLGEKVPAAELQRLGVIRALVSADELPAAASALAGRLVAKSPIALRLAKESMNRVDGLPIKEAYRTEQDYTARLLQFEDSSEARQAYLQKRDPEWRWR